MTAVVDVSIVVDALLGRSAAQKTLAEHTALYAPAHMTLEVLSALARLCRTGALTTEDVDDRLALLVDLPVTAIEIGTELLQAAWQLRDVVAIRDAPYVAIAQSLDAELLTSNKRLARAFAALNY